MPTMEFAPPILSSKSFNDHRKCQNRTSDGRIISQSAITTGAITGQPTEKTDWRSQDNDIKANTIQLKDFDKCASLLQVCSSVKFLQQVHAHMFRIGVEQNTLLETKLVSMYAMYGSMENARLVFDKIFEPNVFLWNSMIRGYVGNGLFEEALTLCYKMQRAGIEPDKFTFPFVLKACAGLSALKEGREIHEIIVRSGFESDVFVGNSLVAMYAKCGRMEFARKVFDKMTKRDVVSWNTTIAGYVQSGRAEEALTLFHQMNHADVKPTPVTMASVLPACTHLAALQQGKLIHGYIIRSGFELEVVVGTALIDMYANCGSIEIARRLFDRMPVRNVVSWNAMISGYAKNGHSNEALKLFNQMQLEDMKPNSVTMLSVLPACAHSAALQQGKRIHGGIIRRGFELDVVVGTALIDMYAQCGSAELARHLFDKMVKRNVITWNAMIAAYAQNGYANWALALFNQMQLTDTRPDTVTMVNVLHACAQLAALQYGKLIHGYVIRSGFDWDVFVWNSLVDMYAKCGSIQIARQLFDNCIP